tara:strand:+ start:174 stop:374 length:201 start_codon:yes stop_codon:yes gene_type:complete
MATWTMTPIKITHTNCLAISKAKIRKQPIATIKPVAGYIGIKAIPKAEHNASSTQKIICIITAPPI